MVNLMFISIEKNKIFSKSKLEITKRRLNDKIKRYNEELYLLKDEEKLLNEKDSSLKNLETYISNALEIKQINENDYSILIAELETLYSKYQEIYVNGLQDLIENRLESINNSDANITSRFQIMVPSTTIDKPLKPPQKDYRIEYCVNNENDKSLINRAESTFENVDGGLKMRSKSGTFNNIVTQKFYEKGHNEEILSVRYPDTAKHFPNMSSRVEVKLCFA